MFRENNKLRTVDLKCTISICGVINQLAEFVTLHYVIAFSLYYKVTRPKADSNARQCALFH